MWVHLHPIHTLVNPSYLAGVGWLVGLFIQAYQGVTPQHTFTTLAQSVTSMLVYIHGLSTWNSTHYTTISCL